MLRWSPIMNTTTLAMIKPISTKKPTLISRDKAMGHAPTKGILPGVVVRITTVSVCSRSDPRAGAMQCVMS